MTVIHDDKAKENIKANVTRLMLELGNMSQIELARRTKENAMTISRVVRGKHMPGAGLLARIAEALGTSTDALIATPPKRPRKQPETKYAKTG